MKTILESQAKTPFDLLLRAWNFLEGCGQIFNSGMIRRGGGDIFFGRLNNGLGVRLVPDIDQSARLEILRYLSSSVLDDCTCTIASIVAKESKNCPGDGSSRFYAVSLIGSRNTSLPVEMETTALPIPLSDPEVIVGLSILLGAYYSACGGAVELEVREVAII